MKLPDTPGSGLTLLHAIDTHLTVTNCIFSQVGKGPETVTVARLEGAADAKRCRFQQCYVRGGQFVVLDVNAPGAEVLLDRCLVVGGEPALLQVPMATNGRSISASCDPPCWRIRTCCVYSRPNPRTFTRAELFRLGHHPEPAGHRRGRADAVSRPRPHEGGRLGGVRWQALNACYAGWELLRSDPKLLGGRGSEEVKAWRAAWGLGEVDDVQPQPWPADALPSVAELKAVTFFPN